MDRVLHYNPAPTGAATRARRLHSTLEHARRSAGWAPEAAVELTTRAPAALVELAVWSGSPELLARADGWIAEALAVAWRGERPDLVLQALWSELQLCLVEGADEAALDVADRALTEPLSRADEYWRMTLFALECRGGEQRGDAARSGPGTWPVPLGTELDLLLASHKLGTRGPRCPCPTISWTSPGRWVTSAPRASSASATRSTTWGRAERPGRSLLAGHARVARPIDAWYLDELAVFALAGTAFVSGRSEGELWLHGALSATLPAIRTILHPRPVATYDVLVEGARVSLG
jgi:hypothetical protein